MKCFKSTAVAIGVTLAIIGFGGINHDYSEQEVHHFRNPIVLDIEL
jgi:hypothetical protein